MFDAFIYDQLEKGRSVKFGMLDQGRVMVRVTRIGDDGRAFSYVRTFNSYEIEDFDRIGEYLINDFDRKMEDSDAMD